MTKEKEHTLMGKVRNNLTIFDLAVASTLCFVLCDACQSTTKIRSAESGATAVDTLVVMSYNIENFFDPEDDPEKNDDEFTPDGPYHWTLNRMQKKAMRLSRVITSANGWQRPDIVGLCEIEGPQAAEALVKEGGLQNRSLNYQPVCFPTPDKRGIATALLYNADRLELQESKAIYVSHQADKLLTRDIVYAKLKFKRTSDVFHCLVNHWPSKRKEETNGSWRRDHVAALCRRACDSIMNTDSDAKIILMGDFNDSADASCLTDMLGAQTRCDTCALNNLSSDTDSKSYKYRGQWNTIDHIIVSRSVCAKGRPQFSVINLPFLLEPDDRYSGEKPRRTYLGRKFNHGTDNEGGYSDHLPVMIKVLL